MNERSELPSPAKCTTLGSSSSAQSRHPATAVFARLADAFQALVRALYLYPWLGDVLRDQSASVS